MNIDMDYIKTEAAKQCYWLKDGVFNLPEWTRAMMQIAADRAGSKINSMKRDLDACRPYLKEGETAADALARLSAADEWRPIATAPAHGVRVLATWDNTWSKGGEHIEVCEAGERGEWFYSFDCDAPATEPTHWMPLPAAPTTTEDIEMSFDEQPDGDIHADDPASYSAEGVQCYLFALLDEANRRGGMFPQTGDEQRSDSKAVHRVCEMVDWYARSGEPKPKQIDRLLKLRARNKITNRETDGDIHGERAAESEPSELSAFEKWWAMLSKVPYMSKKEIAERAFYAGETASHELRFDACRPYLKECETAADALERLSNHSNSSGLSWNGHNIYGDADSIKEARDAIEYKASRFAAFAAKLWPDEDIDAPTTKETT